MSSARFGDLTVTGEEVVFADADGVLFVPIQLAQDILAGKRLREQLQSDEYLARRSAEETYRFWQHLRAIGGAIEE